MAAGRGLRGPASGCESQSSTVGWRAGGTGLLEEEPLEDVEEFLRMPRLLGNLSIARRFRSAISRFNLATADSVGVLGTS